MERERNNSILMSNAATIQRGHYYVGEKEVEMSLSTYQQEQARCYLPEEVYDLFDVFGAGTYSGNMKSRCYVHIENKDTFEVAKEMSKQVRLSDERVAVLNFANPVTPGGGVRNGARAQEETLCLRSTLLKSLESLEASEYYKYNRALRYFGGSDGMILSKNVEVIRDSKYNYLENSFLVSVLSCAAPMVSPFSHRLEDMSQEQMEALLYRRILSMLAVFIANDYKRVILGAWGCGAYCNDPVIVANLFRKAFEEIEIDRFFDEICFAILSTGVSHNYEVFSQCFREYKFW